MGKVFDAVCSAGKRVYGAVRGGCKFVVEKANSTVTAVCLTALAVFGVSGGVFAEEADPRVIAMPTTSPIKWKESADGLLQYLSSNLTPILGITLAIVAIVVVFRWLVKGASGRV